MDAVKQRPTGRPLRVVIGVDDVLPKEIAHALIEPALRLPEGIRLLCREASLERLVADLALHELDVVLSDAPITPSLNFRAYNHPLGECEVSWVGTADLASKVSAGIPEVPGWCTGPTANRRHRHPARHRSVVRHARNSAGRRW